MLIGENINGVIANKLDPIFEEFTILGYKTIGDIVFNYVTESYMESMFIYDMFLSVKSSHYIILNIVE